ncbi:TonB-dependent receptor [Fibrobacter sp. UWB11]|uniref:TonB-dependent receptor n=1 Tax=Fibrobacter sp. UWB11 TaxID=1896202 RepID=UPI00092B9B68|nr:TonB-dependent receptor [Fibrobacter sp. UWB11]SIO31151.1 iron complex outermembrane recepter protein [Fibrobacter sp. UWB11]
MMNNTLIRAVMGSLLCGGFLHFSFAQEFVQDLGNSTIVAEQSTETILDGLRKDEELQAEKLDRKISTTIAETIKNEPDIAIRSMGPAAARPVIKGLSGSHVAITEDGSFCGDMSATSPDHAVASEVLTAHKLNIVRGPRILSESFATAGGVIHVNHQDIPFEIATVHDSLSSDSSNSQLHGYVTGYTETGQPGFATVVGVNGNIHGLSFKGEVSARNMGDMQTPNGTLKNTDIENRSIAIGAAYSLERFKFGVSFRSFNSNYGIPGGFIGGHPNGVDIDLFKRDLTLLGLYLPAQKSSDTLSVTFRFNQYHHTEYETKKYVGAEFAVNQANLRIEKFIANSGPFFGIRLGTELDSRSVEMGGYVFTPPTNSYAASLFSIASLNGWDGLEITLSARLGGAFFRPRESIVADKDAIEDRNFALWAFAAEFSQIVAPGKFLTLDIFRTTRAPSIEELYNQGPHLAAYTYERGYHKLDDESGYGAELEFRDYGEHINWRASTHITWFLNHLAPRATGDTNWSQLLPIYQVSGDDALLMGANASIETSAEQGFYAQAGASYVCGFYQNENWSDMPQIPPFKFHGEIAYLWTHVRAGLNAEFALAQNRTDRYEERTPGYITFGASLEFHWSLALAHYSIILRGENLFDADVRNHLSRLKSVMPEKGRNLSLLAKAEF